MTSMSRTLQCGCLVESTCASWAVKSSPPKYAWLNRQRSGKCSQRTSQVFSTKRTRMGAWYSPTEVMMCVHFDIGVDATILGSSAMLNVPWSLSANSLARWLSCESDKRERQCSWRYRMASHAGSPQSSKCWRFLVKTVNLKFVQQPRTTVSQDVQTRFPV